MKITRTDRKPVTLKCSETKVGKVYRMTGGALIPEGIHVIPVETPNSTFIIQLYNGKFVETPHKYSFEEVEAELLVS